MSAKEEKITETEALEPAVVAQKSPCRRRSDFARRSTPQLIRSEIHGYSSELQPPFIFRLNLFSTLSPCN
nr:hypothetical protein Iba_chr01cCG6020 [Ipomoea batatas]